MIHHLSMVTVALRLRGDPSGLAQLVLSEVEGLRATVAVAEMW